MEIRPAGLRHSDNAFDLIRFIAALGVLYSHSFPLTGQPEPTYLSGETIGTLCVFIFFGVSGYLVQKSWDRNRNPRSFIINRGLRIYPGLVACVFLSAFFLGPMTSMLPAADYLINAETYKFTLSNLTMFLDKHGSLPGVFNHLPFPNSVNGSLWTIRFEIFMYIVLLVVVMAFRNSTVAHCILLGFFLCVWGIGKYIGLEEPGELLWRLNYIGLHGGILRLAPFFLAGALLARQPRSILNPYLASAGIVALFLFADAGFGIVLLWILLPYCVMTAAYHAPEPLKHFGRYGDFSYGIYLYAFPVQQTLSYLEVRSWPLHLGLSVIVTLCLAVFSWKCIESPALRLKAGAGKAPAHEASAPVTSG
jgi:peptidoglycan/LPS O-acetylase OafA/YrhL